MVPEFLAFSGMLCLDISSFHVSFDLLELSVGRLSIFDKIKSAAAVLKPIAKIDKTGTFLQNINHFCRFPISISVYLFNQLLFNFVFSIFSNIKTCKSWLEINTIILLKSLIFELFPIEFIFSFIIEDDEQSLKDK